MLAALWGTWNVSLRIFRFFRFNRDWTCWGGRRGKRVQRGQLSLGGVGSCCLMAELKCWWIYPNMPTCVTLTYSLGPSTFDVWYTLFVRKLLLWKNGYPAWLFWWTGQYIGLYCLCIRLKTLRLLQPPLIVTYLGSYLSTNGFSFRLRFRVTKGPSRCSSSGRCFWKWDMHG